MDRVDAVVIGAGLVGLAVARALATAGREVVILEAEDAIGTHTSSRNSEVIHAGIYYPQGSLKARACVEGRERLYGYCAERGVPHRRCGKLIVATDAAQLAELEGIRQRAHANGVTDVVRVSPAQARALEPELHCVAALHSPSTGIIDSHVLMLTYLGDAERAGAMLALKSPLAKGVMRTGGIELHVAGAEPILAAQVVNSAGLRAPSLARRIEGYPVELAPPEFYAKGNYYTLATALAVLAPRLPGARAGRPGRARDARPRRARALRPGRGMGGQRSTTRWIRGAPSASMRRSGATGPDCPMARSSRATPASARRSRARTPPPQISSYRARARMVCRVS